LKKIKINELSNEAVEIKLKYNGNRWRIVTLYSQEIEEIIDLLLKQIQEEERDHLLLRGDFSARIGNEGSSIKEEIGEKRNKIRKSIDKVVTRA